MNARRDLAWAALGAVLAGIVTVVIEALTHDAPSYLILAACIVLLGWLTVLSLRLLGPPRLVFASTEGVEIDGKWTGTFWYEKDGQPVTIYEELTITQRGRAITGLSRSTAVEGGFPFTATAYAFVATLRVDGVLDGTWKTIEGTRRYHGSLQALISRKGNLIDGNWIGVDATGLRRGEFKWIRTA